MEIGERLREAREAKGLSLESVQESTKIQKRYLEAIEQGNFHILPGKFYARAFIKEYATAVGIDAKELLEEYKEEIPKTEDDSTAQYTQIRSSRKDNNPTKGTPVIFSMLPTIIVILLIVGILFAAWFFITKDSSGEKAEPVEEQDSNQVVRNDQEDQDSVQLDDDKNTNDDSKEESKSGSADKQTKSNESNADQQKKQDENKPGFEVIEKGTGASPESTLSMTNAGDKVILTLKPTGDSWVELKNGDGKILYSGLLTTEDDVKEFNVSDSEKIHLNIGSARSLTVKINDVKVEYPLNPEEKVHQYLWIMLNGKNSAGE
ncbi:helix-turn-helix domain-containing protein [Virgibacillus ihumii]|uniref:helix-turn-helix domain-containing protein n=1 Tax=Virgibacillus ihumii TaxID=2686091 RepID=UPI00157C3F6D|nr:RodZ domain-containing protein [Virgibacillus ihumii]